MKRRIFFAILLIAAAWFAGRHFTHRHQSAEAAGRDETHETFEMQPGARVEVRGINGNVKVETSATTTAEVHVVRTADNGSALANRRISVEQNSTGLVVRGESRGGGWWRRIFGGSGQAREEVTLRVPRRVNLETRGINGQVVVGEIDGSVEVSGVNGSVELGQASVRAELNGVNGQVTLALDRAGERGIGMSGINGDVEFRIRESINADVEVTGQNGGVTLNVPNVTRQERPNRSRMSARFGSGGAPVRLSGINGNVRFQTAAPTG
ncbi:MAG TPA: hypothetical protein VF240_18555 [Pyrinomonadaceae bacterium]